MRLCRFIADCVVSMLVDWSTVRRFQVGRAVAAVAGNSKGTDKGIFIVGCSLARETLTCNTFSVCERMTKQVFLSELQQDIAIILTIGKCGYCRVEWLKTIET